MSGGWKDSNRRQRLPDNWPVLRAQVIMRAGGICEEVKHSRGTRCTNPGVDVDHIEPGDDHSLGNLRLLCRWHHKAKSSAEGNEAKQAKRVKARRQPERHPGVR